MVAAPGGRAMLAAVVVESQAVPVEPNRDRSLAARFGGVIRRRWKKDLLFFAIALSVFLLDQFTKGLVRQNLDLYETWPSDSDGFIRIIHVVNSGAAFGILQGQTAFLIITSSLGLAAILLYYLYPPMDHGLIRVALGMQLGGALGNFLDRLRFQEVTDWIDVGNFPTFNVADAAISTSIVAVILFFLQQEMDSRDGADKQQQHPDAGHGAHDD